MARLPVPGADQGNWGEILNTYLTQVHKADGTLKPEVVTDGAIAPTGISQSKIQGLATSLNGKMNTSGGVTGIWSGTQAAYDAIATKNPATLYVITEG